MSEPDKARCHVCRREVGVKHMWGCIVDQGLTGHRDVVSEADCVDKQRMAELLLDDDQAAAFEAGRHSRDNEVGALLAERDRLNQQLNEAHSYWRHETDMELAAAFQSGVLVPHDLANRMHSYAVSINSGGGHSDGYRERALVDADALAVLLDGPVVEEADRG